MSAVSSLRFIARPTPPAAPNGEIRVFVDEADGHLKVINDQGNVYVLGFVDDSTPLLASNNLSDLENAADARVNLGLGNAISGPSSSVDGNIAIFDGTTGKLLKDSTRPLSYFLTNNVGNAGVWQILPIGTQVDIAVILKAKGSAPLVLNSPDDTTGIYIANDGVGVVGGLEVGGGLSAASFSGNGNGISNLNASSLTSGTVPAARGGAGAVNGILKANGSGVVSAATAGTDYLTPSGSGANLSGVVLLTGAQTIQGVKSFGSSVTFTDVSTAGVAWVNDDFGGAQKLVGTPTGGVNTVAVVPSGNGTLLFANGSGANLSGVVLLTGAQTVAGAKTFSDGVIVPGISQYQFNVSGTSGVYLGNFTNATGTTFGFSKAGQVFMNIDTVNGNLSVGSASGAAPERLSVDGNASITGNISASGNLTASGTNSTLPAQTAAGGSSIMTRSLGDVRWPQKAGTETISGAWTFSRASVPATFINTASQVAAQLSSSNVTSSSAMLEMFGRAGTSGGYSRMGGFMGTAGTMFGLFSDQNIDILANGGNGIVYMGASTVRTGGVFEIRGAHVGGSTGYKRYADNSSAAIYPFIFENWRAGDQTSRRTQLVLEIGNPAATTGQVQLLAGIVDNGGDAFTLKEFLIGSYNFSNADIVLAPGQTQAMRLTTTRIATYKPFFANFDQTIGFAGQTGVTYDTVIKAAGAVSGPVAFVLPDPGTSSDTAIAHLGPASQTFSGNRIFNGTNNTAPNQTAGSGSSLMTRDLCDSRFGGPVYLARKSADQSVTSSTTMTDASGLSISLPTGTYQLSVIAFFEMASNTPGAKAQWSSSSNVTMTLNELHSNLHTPPTSSFSYGTNNESARNFDGGAGNWMYRSDGIIVVSTPVTFKFQFAQSTSSADATTLKAGAFILARKIA